MKIQIKNDHKESSDISGYRDGVADRISRRRKDEVLECLSNAFEKKNDDLYSEGRSELTLAELILMAWYEGLIEGRKQGSESEKFRAEFRRDHGLKEDSPMPPPRKMLEMMNKKSKK